LVSTRDVGSGAVDPEDPASGTGDSAGDGTGDGAGDGTGDSAEGGTGDSAGDGTGDGTEAADALPTPTLATTAPEAGELPQTGLGVWGVAIAVLGMLALLVVARRLRTA